MEGLSREAERADALMRFYQEVAASHPGKEVSFTASTIIGALRWVATGEAQPSPAYAADAPRELYVHGVQRDDGSGLRLGFAKKA